MMSVASLLLLVSFLVEVHSQTAPYVSFMSQTLANHSYVDLSLVGQDGSGSDSVQCHTDLGTCCTGGQGVHRGDWYSPGSTDRLPFSNEVGDIYEQRIVQRVDLRRRNSATSPVGIYRCEIPTNEVHDDSDNSVRATVYVGLYTASGGKLTAVLLKRKTGYKQFQVRISYLFVGIILRFAVVCVVITLKGTKVGRILDFGFLSRALAKQFYH